MASSLVKEYSQGVQHQTSSRALADIGYNSIISDLETATNSDSEPDAAQKIPPQDVPSVIGFSIGHEQARLASPRTPAVEKAAALGGGDGFFDNLGLIAENVCTEEPGNIEDQGQGTSQEEQSSKVAERQPRQTAQVEGSRKKASSTSQLPSPWRATPKIFQQIDTSKGANNDANEERREKTISGPFEAASGSIRRFLPSLPSLPSLPKSPSLFKISLPSLTNPLGSGHAREIDQQPIVSRNHRRRHSSPLRNPTFLKGTSIMNPEGRNQKVWANDDRRPSPRHIQIAEPSGFPQIQRQRTSDRMPSSHARNPLLRRVTSDESLLLHRQTSRVSSLGDDSRFENVSEQVNSRMKAIMDSLQDSNIRLPNLSIPNFSFGSSRQDDVSPVTTENALNKSKSRNYRPKSLSLTSSPLQKIFDDSARSSNYLTPEPPKSGGLSSTSAATHPYLAQALEQLEGDVVILGGYRGSVLRSAEPPNRQLWVPVKVGLNLRKVDLQVGLDPEADENMEEHIIPGGMLTHIGPVDMSRRLFKRLRASRNARNGKLRVWDYGYDWRLAPHLLSRKLIQYLDKLPSNQADVPVNERGAVVIAHSLGGLITRHAINHRPELFSGVVYAGVPTTCVNILGPLRNGDDVLFSSRVLTAQVNFTIRTSFALLPLDGRCFIDKETKEELPVDFFDVKTWADYCLTPVLAPPLPPLSSAPSGPLDGLLESVSNAFASVSLPLRKGSVSRRRSPRTSISDSSPHTRLATTSDSTTVQHHRPGSDHQHQTHGGGNAVAYTSGVTPQMHGPSPHIVAHQLGPKNSALSNLSPSSPSQNLATPTSASSPAISLPHDAAIKYLTRTLAEVKAFKQELAFQPALGESNAYPPASVIFGKATPTVYGAKVVGRDGIRRTDAYDDLAFASGDGVVLARAAMLPEGYSVVRGGMVSSERGHVTLLGDLEAVGKCLVAVMDARKRGLGLGVAAREMRRGDVDADAERAGG